jgi:hypothetical protein
MKRVSMAICVVGLVATMGMAASNEVTSVNIVGYNTAIRPVGGTFNLIGVQFDAFDPTLLGVLGTNQLVAGVAPQFADRVYIYDPSLPGYKQYAMKTGTGSFYNTAAWSGSATNPPVPAGTAMWIQSKTGTASNMLTIAGEAVDVATQSVDIVQGFQLLAYPFSCEVDLNATSLKTVGTKGVAPQFADRVYVWTGTTYNQYALHTSGEFRSTSTWSQPAGPITIPLGTGFWYDAKNGFAWQEANKYLSAFGN